MRTRTMLLLALAAMLVLPGTSHAQLNKLMKKVKKTAEQVLAPVTETAEQMLAPITGTSAEANPLADVADIQLLYAAGDTVSTNYGRVTLVLSVNMKANKPQIRLGSVNNAAMMAVTPNGTVYKPDLNLNGVYPKDVVEGTAVTIPLNDPDMVFTDIPLGTSMFQTVKLGVMVDPQHKATLTFHNVPIRWERRTTSR